MQNLTSMDKVVLEDCYHMTRGNEIMNWMKLTHLLSSFLSKPYGALLYIYLYFSFLNSLFEYTH